MESLFDRLRTRRLASAFVLLATLSAAIVAGSFAAHGVRGQEKQNGSADATPLKVVSSSVPSNEFVKIAKQVGPAVVNINTETLPKQSSIRRRTPHGAIPMQPQNPDGQNPGDDDQNGGQGSRALTTTSRTSSITSSVGKRLIRAAVTMAEACRNRSVPVSLSTPKVTSSPTTT